MRLAIGIGTALALLATGAPATSALGMGGWSEGGAADVDNCKNEDGALSEAAFVIVTAPGPGERVGSGFAVTGCSRSFESTVNWRLVGSGGTELASGHSKGGGVDGPGPFSFKVDYKLSAPEIGHLEVFEEDASGGEGKPPGRTVLPLVLQP